MNDPPPAVVMMARAPRRGLVYRALEPLIGAEACVALQRSLLGHTAAWARRVAGERLYVAYEPADARDELAALVGLPATFFPQNGEGIASRSAAACAHVFASGERPLLLIWPSVPRLGAGHAAAALGDLRAGCDVVFGPVFDGGLYLLGVRRPTPAVFGLPERSWRSPELISIAIASAREAGLEVGLLRPERSLQRPPDLRAALADPLLAPELRAIVGEQA